MRTYSFLAAIFFMLMACVGASAPSNAYAQGAQSDIPLLVLRYNQPRIYYDKQLYAAVSKAVAIKPDVRFSLVSFVPANGSDDRQEQMAALASQQTNQVVAALKNMGVPQSRVNVSRETMSDARYHEIYMYVD
jgi:hypothetical protein